eukprot:gene15726-biopygen13930
MLTWATVTCGAAAAVALLVLAASSLRPPRHTAETAVGAFQKFDLPDGSVAQLNTDSAIDAAFTATERRIRLVRGEVFFTVTKDPSRPFIVTSGPVAVRAVGTAFNVNLKAATVDVLVTEGVVELNRPSPAVPTDATAAPNAVLPRLTANERAIVSLVPTSPTS